MVYIIKTLSNPSEEILLKLVEIDWTIIAYISKEKQTVKICKEAIRQSCFARFYVKINLNKKNTIHYAEEKTCVDTPQISFNSENEMEPLIKDKGV